MESIFAVILTTALLSAAVIAVTTGIALVVYYLRKGRNNTDQQPCESCGNCLMVDARLIELEDRVGELTKANEHMATCIKVLFKVYTRPDSYARTMEVHDVPSGKCFAQRLTHEALAHLGPEVACLQPGEEAAIQLQYNGGVYLYHRLAD